MWRHSYSEDWGRKKSYLVRSLFHDIPPLLSPVPEESIDSSDAPPRAPSPIAYRPCSPLPPLIIEKEPNRHDEPDEYYKKLAVKIRTIYKEMFIEGREFSDSDLSDDNIDITNDSVNDSNLVSINGYCADYDSYASAVPSVRTERNDSNDSRDVNNDENNNSKNHNVYEESCETENETVDLTVHDELAEDVSSETTEHKSGSDYRQVTTQAQIHVDGNQIETQSTIYEGSERSIILTTRQLRRVEAGQKQETERSEESMADEQTVMLEDNDDPEDVHMPHNEPLENTDAEVNLNIEGMEVMRTPQPEISVDSVTHATHSQSDGTDKFIAMHHASLMTTGSNNSKANEDVDSGSEDRGRKKSTETIFHNDVASHVSPILNVGSLNVDRHRIIMEEEFTSDMDITLPVSHVSFLKTETCAEGASDFGDRTSETHGVGSENVESLNGGDEENLGETSKRISINIRAHEALRYESSSNADEMEGMMTDTYNLNGDTGRKRRKEISVQTVSERVCWEDLKGNFFVGAPKIFKLCRCRDHVCT